MLDTYKKPKPRIRLDEADLPAIKDWEVGKTYTVTAKVKMVHQSEGNEYDDYSPDGESKKPVMSATLKVISMSPAKEVPATGKKKGKMLMRVKA